MTDAKKSQLSKIQLQLAAAEDDDDCDEESDNDDDKIKNLDSKKVHTKEDKENDSGSEVESDKEESSADEEENPTGKRKGSPVQSKAEESSKKLKIDEEKQDVQRNRFRAKLSKMSIEEIHRLKNKLGLKLFNQKMSDKSSEAKKSRRF